MNKQLPEAYVDEMRKILGDEAEAFFASYEKEAYAGVRCNTGKLSPGEFEKQFAEIGPKVPWADGGYYLLKDASMSKHPYYFAGLFYQQEPSAMMPAGLLPLKPGDKVLDLCAAPGGKATQLASRLSGGGLLVANDISVSRANALLNNLTRWGYANVCITSETPKKLLAAYGSYFDCVLVDAPCSGEGMFRKEPFLAKYWLENGPDDYAGQQKQILRDAVKMVKPGGCLLYSTCTFSPVENEDVIASVLDQNPDFCLEELPSYEGFAPGLVRGKPEDHMERCVRLYPHRVKGEGHFAALLRRAPDAGSVPPQETAAGNCELSESVRHFLTFLPQDFLAGYRFRRIDDNCMLIPPFAVPEGLRYLRTGALLGTLKDERFAPSQALAMLLSPETFAASLDLDLSDERVIRYLKGETISLTGQEISALGGADGWVLVSVNGHSLGWGKLLDDKLKNKYHPGWRMR